MKEIKLLNGEREILRSCLMSRIEQLQKYMTLENSDKNYLQAQIDAALIIYNKLI